MIESNRLTELQAAWPFVESDDWCGEFSEKNTQDCRDCEKAATLAGELIAMIRLNALRGTFATATFEEIEDHLKPWIARLMEIRHRPIIPAIREANT